MARESWNIDPVHSSITFWVRHLMVSKVHGRFTTWTGNFTFDSDDPAHSSVEVEIDAASIDTKEPQRDGHLRSPDFLDAEHHPHIKFKSTEIKRVAEDRFSLTGDLTIRGATRPITLDVEYSGRVKDPWGGERAGFSARTSLARKDYGLGWNQVLEAGGVVVGDKVEIAIEMEVIKATAAAPKT